MRADPKSRVRLAKGFQAQTGSAAPSVGPTRDGRHVFRTESGQCDVDINV